MATEQELSELTSGKDTSLHSHEFDRTPTHLTLDTLQSIEKQTNINTTPYSATYQDDYILVDSTAAPVVITFPYSRGGKELEVVRVAGANNVTVQRISTTDKINGGASVVISSSYVGYRFKAFAGYGWVQV